MSVVVNQKSTVSCCKNLHVTSSRGLVKAAFSLRHRSNLAHTSFNPVQWKLRRPVVCEAGASSVESGNVKEFSSLDEFNSYLKDAGEKLVLVDIATRTCGPCKFIFPKVVQMSLDYPDAVFLKILGDKDDNTRALMREWGIRAVPCFRFYRNGELVHQHTGAKEEVLKTKFAEFYGTS